MKNLQLTPFRLLIDQVVDRARPHFWQMFLPIAVPMALVGWLLSVWQFRWLESLVSEPESFADLLPTFGSLIGVLVLILVVYGLGFSVLQVAAVDAVAGRPVDMGRAWRFVLRPTVLVTLLLITLASIISLMMCFLPALYVVPLLSFVVPAMVDEEMTGRAAVRRSSELIHWNPTGRPTESPWIQVLVLLFIGWVVSNAVSFTVQLPFLLLQQLLLFREAAAGEGGDPSVLVTGQLWLQMPATILGSLATAATWFYWVFGLAMLYREVRRRKEAADLEAAFAALTRGSSQT